MATPQPLNLLSLARTDPGEAKLVPGTRLEVQALKEMHPLKLAQAVWLTVLAGELIIDLPFGDFRTLQEGDSLHLEAGLELTLTPLEETVILQMFL